MTDKQRIHQVRIAVAAYQERITRMACEPCAYTQGYYLRAGDIAAQTLDTVIELITLRCDRCGSTYVPCECGTDN